MIPKACPEHEILNDIMQVEGLPNAAQKGSTCFEKQCQDYNGTNANTRN